MRASEKHCKTRKTPEKRCNLLARLTPSATQIKRKMRISRQNFERFPDSASMTLDECVDVAQRSVRSLRNDIQSGRLGAVKVAGQVRVTAGELRRFLAGGTK
jgi:hypothetical protein